MLLCYSIIYNVICTLPFLEMKGLIKSNELVKFGETQQNKNETFQTGENRYFSEKNDQ